MTKAKLLSWVKTHQQIVLVTLTLLFVLMNGFLFLQNQAHSFYFEDETEHITLGWMMSQFGSKLYQDLSTNHQPLPIFIGYIFTLIIPTTHFFRFITLLRLMMIGLSVIGTGVIVWKYRWSGFLTILLIEPLKVYFFGFHLLAESLVIYPIAYLMLWLIHLFWSTQPQPESSLEGILLAICFWIIGFNLAMLWPFLIFYLGILLFKASARIKKSFFLTGLGLVILTFLVVSPFDWWRESVWNIWQYFLPYQATTGTTVNYGKVLIYPWLGWFHLNTLTGQILALLSLLFSASAVMMIRQSSQKKSTFIQLMVIYGCLVLLNLRIDQVSVLYYTGFHLLPYLVGLSAITFQLTVEILRSLSPTHKLRGKALFITLFLLLFVLSSHWYTESKNQVIEHTIQYQRFELVGQAIKMISHPGQRLWVGPLHGYVNLIAGLPLADRQNAHLDWVLQSASMKQNFNNELSHNLPEFVYYPDHAHDKYYQLWLPILTEKYTPILTENQRPTELFILNQVSDSFSEEDWQHLAQLGFYPTRTFPTNTLQ